MPQLLDPSIHSVLNTNSAIGVGWKLNFYATGTSTRKNTYPTSADATAGTNANANPVVLGSDGRLPAIWFLDDGDYKLVLTDESDVIKTTVDPVNPLRLSNSSGSSLVGYLHSATANATTVQGALRRWLMADDYMSPAFTAAQNTTGWGKIVTLVGSGSATVQFGVGTYSIDTAMTIPAGTSLHGMGSGSTTLLFTGATDGLKQSNFGRLDIRGFTLSTSSATAGKALRLETGSRGQTIDIQISKSGSGRWAYGWWTNNWQTSNFYATRIDNNSCTVGVHHEYASNANHFFGLEVIGSSGAGTIERAVEMDADNSLAAGRVVFETYFHGGTLQGYFTKSLFYSDGVAPLMDSFHLENTNAAPTDGADVFLTGGIVNPRFINMEGGSFITSGSTRNIHISGQVGVITLATGCQQGLISARYTSLSDADGQVTIVGSSLDTGAGVPAIVNGTTLQVKDNGVLVSEINDTGLMIGAAATAAGGGQIKLGSSTQTTVGAAGAASALPANPTGYLRFFVGATEFVLPYYARV